MALVLVLIFGVGAMVLVTTMLSLGHASAQVEGARHRDKSLHSVARYGLATAINEVNRKRTTTGYEDPTGNGYGCILMGPDGRRGWPVVAPTGQVLGRFTTVVTDDGVTRVLSVVAVEGQFPVDAADADARQRAGTLRVATAELEIATGRLAFDRNALSVRGPAGAGGRGGVYADPSAPQVRIYGNNVPAVNISDAALHARFIEPGNIGDWGALTGLDPETGSAALTRPATVTQNEAGLINQETLTSIAQGIDARVGQILATGVPVTDTNTTLPRGAYFIDTTLVVPSGQVLNGSGTLVVNKGVDLKGKINWDGEVIIANSTGATVAIDNAAELNVNGVLAIQGIGTATDMGVWVKGGGKVSAGTATSPGAFTILGDANTTNPLRFSSGAQGAYVNGIFTIMGNALSMTFDTGAKLDVQGSLALITPTEATTGLDIKFRQGAHMTLNYTDANFDGAVQRLGAFFDPSGSILPLQISGYLEDTAHRRPLLDLHVAADPGQPHGTE